MGSELKIGVKMGPIRESELLAFVRVMLRLDIVPSDSYFFGTDLYWYWWKGVQK